MFTKYEAQLFRSTFTADTHGFMLQVCLGNQVADRVHECAVVLNPGFEYSSKHQKVYSLLQINIMKLYRNMHLNHCISSKPVKQQTTKLYYSLCGY